MRDSFLVFGQPCITQEDIDEVVDSMQKAWLGTGPKVHAFERDFAQYKQLPYAAAVNSCTAALHLACLACGLESGGEVITTAMTFCASVNAIIHAGGTPILVDVDPVTLNISPEAIKKSITSKTKALLIVHYAGRPCDMDSIMAIAHEHNLPIIEDCAHAIETEYHGIQAGAFGTLSCFSFYATKNIATGEGGMVLSRDKSLIDRIKVMALHGMSADAWSRFSDSGYKHYQVIDHGFKYNMMDMQAAIGIHQLKRIESYWLRRQEIWNRYMRSFADTPLVLPAPIEPETRHAYHLFTIRINTEKCRISRDSMLSALNAARIGVGVHYLAIPEHPFYQKRYGWRPEDYPVAMNYGRETISLPLSPKLTDQDVTDVIEAVLHTLSAHRI